MSISYTETILTITVSTNYSITSFKNPGLSRT